MKAIQITLPVYWAIYLVNGDASGLEPAEKRRADDVLARIQEDYPGAACVSCEDEAHFSRWADYDSLDGLSGEVLEFTFIFP